MSEIQNKLQIEKNIRESRVGVWFKNILRPSLEGNKNICINFEIGCGHGHWLTSYAQQNPSQNFVGIDLITKRIEKATSKVVKRKLSNVCFCKADANEFLEFCDVNLSNTYIMYPDPWPKKRHFKRRLIQLPFLDRLAQKTQLGGKLYFMTDHVDYFDWSCSMISESIHWNFAEEEWPHQERSYFQNILPTNKFFCALRS